ncbi:30S ribosomal protein S5, chloroplastic [Selaginella moellendorffii]|nr:30S ribosomal protein S5, chloroplastic [Selaginella moellendorffii]|eukprot:XP_002966319.2 30S ribosomal protein S5, chloroplastic [Selaginella moellendorffii]
MASAILSLSSGAATALESSKVRLPCAIARRPTFSLKSQPRIGIANPLIASGRRSKQSALLVTAAYKGRLRADPSMTDPNDDVGMSTEEIKEAYESLYGPSWERKKASESTAEEEEERGGGRRRRGEEGGPGGMGGRRGGSKDGLEESVVQVRRVTKVVKGGKQLQFRVVSVVGDKKGKVGVGVGKAKEVIAAVQKSVKDARRNIVTVRMTKYKTFPHRVDGHYHAADVMLRPASPGTGIIAGGAVRVVLEMAGIENALGKQMGSDNTLNNARATLHAVSQLRHFHEVAELRGIPIEVLWK